MFHGYFNIMFILATQTNVSESHCKIFLFLLPITLLLIKSTLMYFNFELDCLKKISFKNIMYYKGSSLILK